MENMFNLKNPIADTLLALNVLIYVTSFKNDRRTMTHIYSMRQNSIKSNLLFLENDVKLKVMKLPVY